MKFNRKSESFFSLETGEYDVAIELLNKYEKFFVIEDYINQSYFYILQGKSADFPGRFLNQSFYVGNVGEEDLNLTLETTGDNDGKLYIQIFNGNGTVISELNELSSLILKSRNFAYFRKGTFKGNLTNIKSFGSNASRLIKIDPSQIPYYRSNNTFGKFKITVNFDAPDEPDAPETPPKDDPSENNPKEEQNGQSGMNKENGSNQQKDSKTGVIVGSVFGLFVMKKACFASRVEQESP